ncbi:MAG TPA: metalloregulator ArsR/SmtB family transcription factor [Fimbriimonadaceae bacterium]|nr:metalloregulator ArsR/SmtB family transcription factor [Fimbriimonadaceae bacterium]
MKVSYDPAMAESLRKFKADIFQALGHPTRIAIVELLRDGEVSAGVFPEALGVEPANASQHLAVLRSKRIVRNRKEGNQVFYSLRDPSLIEVLDIMRRYFERHLRESYAMLQEMEPEAPVV